jgi:hypothetical protein
MMHGKTTLLIMTACAVAAASISCSRSPDGPRAQESKLQQGTNAPADQPVKEFGVVELSEGTPKRLSLAEGKEVTLTTTVLQDGDLQVVITSESKTADGLPTRVERKVTVPSGTRIHSSIDGVEVGWTPILKSK